MLEARRMDHCWVSQFRSELGRVPGATASLRTGDPPLAARSRPESNTCDSSTEAANVARADRFFET